MTELERRLAALDNEVRFPETPSLTVPDARPVRARRGWRVRLALALVVVVAAVGAVLAVSPGARSALRDLFGIGGVTGIRVDRLPAPTAPQGYLPGRAVSLATAQAAVDFRIRVPPGAPPERVLLDERVSGGAVSIVWCCDPELQLTEIAGSSSFAFAQKLLADTRVERFRFDGHDAIWLAGPQHVVRFADGNFTVFESKSRIAGNVLLWRDGDVTLRLEGAATRAEAIAVARTLRY